MLSFCQLVGARQQRLLPHLRPSICPMQTFQGRRLKASRVEKTITPETGSALALCLMLCRRGHCESSTRMSSAALPLTKTHYMGLDGPRMLCHLWPAQLQNTPRHFTFHFFFTFNFTFIFTFIFFYIRFSKINQFMYMVLQALKKNELFIGTIFSALDGDRLFVGAFCSPAESWSACALVALLLLPLFHEGYPLSCVCVCVCVCLCMHVSLFKFTCLFFMTVFGQI